MRARINIIAWLSNGVETLSNNTEYSQIRRDRMRAAGLKEIRGLIYPEEKHDEIKAEVRRKHGNIKVKK